MAIKLLALDLDGTLLNSRGKISERNREAIDRARRRGVRVALVTGRRFRDARPLALELGLDVPLISHNGALTKHARSLETVAAMLLPLSEAREVLRIGRAMGGDALLSDDPVGAGLLVYDHVNESNRAVIEYIAWARRIHGEEAAEAVRHVESLEDYLDHAPVHIGFTGGCAQMERLLESFQSELGGAVKIFATMYPKKDFAILDVVNPEASKGVGLAAVADEQSVLREEVMAMGDNFNDLEMLQYAGTCVLMGNAEESLRNTLSDHAGFHTTATNDEDGVAQAIERFILNGKSQESGV